MVQRLATGWSNACGKTTLNMEQCSWQTTPGAAEVIARKKGGYGSSEAKAASGSAATVILLRVLRRLIAPIPW